jgi:predicted short-subunit dehydrogenase-like oxidoreductase (DUF2520 family)
MIESVNVIGARGRVGRAVSARLAERGVVLDVADPTVVLLCVPDRAIADVAGRLPIGPWLAHVSGATTLGALEPHAKRFSLHPLQTFTHRRGPEQLDGAWAALTSESREARELGLELGALLGLRCFELDDGARSMYHAGAAIAANFLVTLDRVAGAMFETAGAPPEALVPLMRRVIENDFELTGPIERGDLETVASHLEAIRSAHPEFEALYSVLADATVATTPEPVR